MADHHRAVQCRTVHQVEGIRDLPYRNKVSMKKKRRRGGEIRREVRRDHIPTLEMLGPGGEV